MKTLILLRHAKSSWDDPALEDHARALNARGTRDAPRMAVRLMPFLHAVDSVWVSSAVRTQATWSFMATALHAHGADIDRLAISTEPGLYESTANSILRLLAQNGGAHRGILLLHHQPGISYLARHLLGQDPPAFPTCSFAMLECQTDAWDSLTAGCASLAQYDYPKREVDTH